MREIDAATISAAVAKLAVQACCPVSYTHLRAHET